MNSWFDWRPPRGDIAFLAGCLVFASVFFIISGGGSWYTRWVCPFFLPIGIGLWLKHSWARWLTIVLLLAVAVILVMALLSQGFTARRVLQGLIIAVSLMTLWEWKVYPDDQDDE